MTYLGWLRSFDDIDDNQKAAAEALKDLGRLNERARGLLHPILAEAILMERRTRTRSAERSAPIRAVFTGESTIERRERRLSQYMALADGRVVCQGDATEADWLLRIELLEQHRRGLDRSIEEARDAIETIRRYGVTCLSEIEVAS